MGRSLRRLRDDLKITEEQLAPIADDAEDCRVRAMVSETPLAEHEYRRALRHAERLRLHRDNLVKRINRLEADQDRLLERLLAC